ncbi:MAG: PAC2 family protein [Chloroflexota bacterium]
MDNLVELTEKPEFDEIYLIAGWRQWADAGSISSGLPEYLADLTDAKKIGEIQSDPFYMFHLPATHYYLRPEIKFKDGFREEFHDRENVFYFAECNGKGLLLFSGDEPHLYAPRYANAFFDVYKELGVRRGVAVGGVYARPPFDRDRPISCSYSLQPMKEELDKYALRYSNYEGGATIGSYFVDRAARQNLEFMVLNALVPSYEFSEQSSDFLLHDAEFQSQEPQGIRIENDYRAWHDVMMRLNYMFGIGVDLSELSMHSQELTSAIESKLDDLNRKLPELGIPKFLQEINSDFEEMTFMPLDDMWAEELGDLFDDLDD